MILINCSVYQILDVYWSFTITTLGIIYYGIILLLGIYYVLLVFEKLKPIKGLKVFFISLIILMIIFQIIIIFIMVHILSAVKFYFI